MSNHQKSPEQIEREKKLYEKLDQKEVSPSRKKREEHYKSIREQKP